VLRGAGALSLGVASFSGGQKNYKFKKFENTGGELTA